MQAGPQVTLTWTDNANNETGFVVERAVPTADVRPDFATATPGASTGTAT